MPEMTIDELVEKVDSLSPAIQILPKLMELLQDENSDMFEVCGLIKVDPSLVSGVLKLSNSAYFAGSSPVSSLEEAVNRLGQLEVYKMVAVACGRSLLEKDLPAYEIEASELWENAVASGIVMELLAVDQDKRADIAYTIGLLHNIGKLAINQFFEGGYAPVYSLIEREEMPMPEAERAVFGFDHAQLGAKLLRVWNFPESIAIPIEYQYRPLSPAAHRESACSLHFSWLVVAAFGLNAGRSAWAINTPPREQLMPDMTDEKMQDFIVKAHIKYDEIKGALVPSRPRQAV